MGTGSPPSLLTPRRGRLADLELRHRSSARCEDRIRNAKDTGLRNLPLHGFAQNQLWCELVAMASELPAWIMLALNGPARAWEPKRLRLRLFSAAGRLRAAAGCWERRACRCLAAGCMRHSYAGQGLVIDGEGSIACVNAWADSC